MAQVELGNLYDMNKELMKKEKPLDPIQFAQKINEIADAIFDYDYIMLLCHDRRDYTLFNLNSGLDWSRDDLKRELSVTLSNRGTILSIDRQEAGEFEIWVKDIAGECFAYFLFDYSQGVIEVGEQ